MIRLIPKQKINSLRTVDTFVINIMTLIIIQQMFSSTYVPGPVLEIRGSVLSKMDMGPAIAELTVSEGHRH